MEVRRESRLPHPHGRQRRCQRNSSQSSGASWPITNESTTSRHSDGPSTASTRDMGREVGTELGGLPGQDRQFPAPPRRYQRHALGGYHRDWCRLPVCV
jgi:hypothetical protein